MEVGEGYRQMPFFLRSEYSRGIRGVFMGYSWDIRMYRVCVGYVSGMCRECVEAYCDFGVNNG